MNIDVVIVTYNRLKKLKNAICAFENQTKLPYRLVIVNNNSTDDTGHYLNKWKDEKKDYKKIVINLNENKGGAGGFAEGMKYLLENDSKWIWVSDDDAYPKKDALEIANNYLEKNNENEISAICGKVINGGKIDYNHRRYIKKGKLTLKEIPTSEADYLKDNFEIDLFTYVGTIMNVEKLKKIGIANEKFFIYYDDSDHAARLNKVGKIICIPAIEVVHDVDNSGLSNSKYTWKTYYLFRNKLYFYKFNYKAKYYKVEKFLIYLRIIKKINNKCTKLILTSIRDFNNNKMGISDEYRPGKEI